MTKSAARRAIAGGCNARVFNQTAPMTSSLPTKLRTGADQGANVQFGINCRNGIEFVADAVNAAGGIKALGGAKINLIVSDATSNPITAPAVAQRLIAQNELTAVVCTENLSFPKI